MKNKLRLLVSIISIVLTTMFIFLGLALLEPSYINLAYICFMSMVGYSTALVYMIGYYQTLKQK
jgi:hypothetical protein